MNNLFINLDDNNDTCTYLVKYDKNSIFKVFNKNILKNFAYKITGFELKKDNIVSSKNSSTFFLNITPDELLSSKRNCYIFKKALRLNLKNIKELNIVFSKNFDNMSVLKKKLKSLIDEACFFLKTNYIVSTNNLKQLDTMYVTRYIDRMKIDIRKFKLLYVLNNISDFDDIKFKEYVEKYKCIDILRMNDVSKTDYRKLVKIIDQINNEYGSSVQIIQKRNIQDYDFYLLYSPLIKEFFKEHYIINNKAGILDVTNKDDDVASLPYMSYYKNRYYIMTMFDRVKQNIDNFSKMELGMIYKD